jgi:hypothetical protein
VLKQYPRDKELARLAARGYEQLRLLRQEPDASWEPWANLFNKDGLPAQPFRTDDW